MCCDLKVIALSMGLGLDCIKFDCFCANGKSLYQKDSNGQNVNELCLKTSCITFIIPTLVNVTLLPLHIKFGHLKKIQNKAMNKMVLNFNI